MNHSIMFILAGVAVHAASLSGAEISYRDVVGENRLPVAGQTSTDFGHEMPIVRDLGIGPTMGVAVQGGRAYIIGGGKLFIADASQPARPRVVGRLEGLGNVRQVVVAREVAYVASREDGLFVVSVREPTAPMLLCHYNTVEFATGLAISGDVLFVACRQFGVELVDVSNPPKPAHLSTVRTGKAPAETQSVVVRNGWLFSGVWATSEVMVADVRNPRAPTIVARVPLDGYGDGVEVHGKFLYAATGHHSRERRMEETDPGFGHGHGLEIFDISDPASPVFMSRLKFPKFYGLHNDMWSVKVSGTNAFVADTHNGVFVVDVKDARTPRCVAHRQLPFVESRKMPGFVGGLALAQDYIYAAGGWTDLHVLAAPGLASPPPPEPDAPPVIPPAKTKQDEGVRVYRPDGQVYAATLVGETAVIACGSEGIHMVELWPTIKRLAVRPTEDFATDVCALGHTVFIAEGTGGLSVWSATDSRDLKLLGRYRVDGQRIRHVAVPSPGRYALVQVGGSALHIVDVSDPAAPKLALKDERLGLLYGNQIMDGLIENRFATVFWHVSGLHWYDLHGGPKPVYIGQPHADRFHPQEGVTVFDGMVLATRHGGYVIFGRDEKRSLDDLPLRRIAKQPFSGKPAVHGNRLYVSDRAAGAVHIVDLLDPAAPKLLDSFTTPGNPGRIAGTRHGFLIPDGYNGLLVYERHP